MKVDIRTSSDRKGGERMNIYCNHEERYIELDKIRLVVEDGKIVGWYNPNKDNDD